MQTLRVERHARVRGLGFHAGLERVEPLRVAPLRMALGDRNASRAPQTVVSVEMLGPEQAVDGLTSGTAEVARARMVHRKPAVKTCSLGQCGQSDSGDHSTRTAPQWSCPRQGFGVFVSDDAVIATSARRASTTVKMPTTWVPRVTMAQPYL